MLKSMILTCPSDLFTDFTDSLRIRPSTVNSRSLINQRIEGGSYGVLRILRSFYTHTIIWDIFCKKQIQMTRVRARKRYIFSVKSVKSVIRILQTLVNQRLHGFTDFKTHRKKSWHTVKKSYEKEVKE